MGNTWFQNSSPAVLPFTNCRPSRRQGVGQSVSQSFEVDSFCFVDRQGAQTAKVMDYQPVLVMLLLSCTVAETDDTPADANLLHCPGSPEPGHSGCPLSYNQGVCDKGQVYHARITEETTCGSGCPREGNSPVDTGSSHTAEPTDRDNPLLQQAIPTRRSPVQSSQQATAFLVSGWNDLSTWRTGSQALSVCEEDIEEAIKGYIANQMWALQVFDAWAKPGPSLLEGRSMFAGNYHQCRGTRSTAVNSGAGFRGNYCVVSLANLTHLHSANIVELFALSRVQLGACLPDSCSEEDITQVFQERLEAMNLSSFLAAQSTDCLSEEKEFTTFTQVALLIVLVISTLVILGTAIDLAARCPKQVSSNHASEGPANEVDKTTNAESTGVWVKVLLSFSMYTNGKRLLSTSQVPGSVTVIPGLRFLIMSWIIVGHAGFTFIYGRASNVIQGYAFLARYRVFDLIINTPLGIDAFFAISGFLLSYLNMKKVLQNGWKFDWGHYFLHRYWRLTPTYMVAFISVQGLQRFFVYGSTAPTVQPADKPACERNWWMLPLYINNIYRVDFNEWCFLHSWSLAADFQFHLLSPLMLIPFHFHRNAGVASCLVITIAQWIISGCLAYHVTTSLPLILQPVEYFKYCYFPFYARIAPFAIGILTGYIMYANNGRVQMNRPVVVIGWILASAAGLAVLFGVHGDLSGEHPSSLLATSLYHALSRSVWGACVCWVIVACSSGHGGSVNVLLSWSPFTVLGRLTYTGYLINMSILAIIIENLEQPPYLNIASMVVYGTAGLVFTCAVSAILVVCVEMPTLNLEKIRDHKRKL